MGPIFATGTTLFFSLVPGLVAKLVDGAAAPVVLASGLADADDFGWDGETLLFALAHDWRGGHPYPKVPDLVALPVVPDRR
ncbi:MAG TPA: hypothetical protein VH853_12930 [Polyangia bacterium]|nr:hypothetical protein [Polyangia bacterium]